LLLIGDDKHDQIQ